MSTRIAVGMAPSKGFRMAKSPTEKFDQPFATDADLAEMVAQFERCEWPIARWTHRTHLGVAVCYLRAWPLEEALTRIRHHLALYNQACGDPTQYHETITVLFMRRVHRYLQDRPDIPLATAVEDLCVHCNLAWPHQYYTIDRLWSEEARAGWVEPDLRALDF